MKVSFQRDVEDAAACYSQGLILHRLWRPTHISYQRQNRTVASAEDETNPMAARWSRGRGKNGRKG